MYFLFFDIFIRKMDTSGKKTYQDLEKWIDFLILWFILTFWTSLSPGLQPPESAAGARYFLLVAGSSP